MLEIRETELSGVLEITPKVFGDERGWFMESFTERELSEAGVKAKFCQDNHSYSADRGTLRGLHYQLCPMAQAKIVRVTRGEIFDVAVDIRKGSPMYGKWVGVRLSAENKKQVFIPRGFAHGFITLTDDVEVQYKADNYYSPAHDGGIRWNDPEIGIKWPMPPAILSEKDRNAPLLSERAAEGLNFIFGETDE